jgi:hypothetical protein
LATTKILSVMLCSLLCISLASALTNSAIVVNAQSIGWQGDSNLTKGLPSLGRIGENCQCFIFNLKGDGRWSQIIGPFNGWTINEFPFIGYVWDGAQWVSDNSIVKGLTAYANGNDPTVGFNVAGESTFDMIIAGNSYSSRLEPMEGRGWIGYSWRGSQWVENSKLINGLPNFNEDGGGNNFATLVYNLLGDGKWDLIVDNYDNKGYLGFEWDGTVWSPQNILVNGLPNNEAVSPSGLFPVPYVAQGFEGGTVLFVGLASGGPMHGSIECFKWTGTSWKADLSLTYGIDNLPPWPKTPTIAYNVTGNNQWALLIGSASGFVNKTAYYAGYYWTGKSPITISPLSSTVVAGQSITFTATITGNASPYTYQWYVDDRLESSFNSSFGTNSWIFTPTVNMTNYIYVRVTDANGAISGSLKSTLTVTSNERILPIGGGPGAEHSAIPQLFVFCKNNTADGASKFDITGNLSDAGWPLSSQPVSFVYSADGGSSWNQITTVNTGVFGDFLLTWMPPVDGDFLLKADYPGNITYLPISTIVNFESANSNLQLNPISIQTNSTIAAFSFDPTEKQLSFSLTGPDGSTGYINVNISKSILTDISDLNVLLDGEPINFDAISTGYSWLLSFNYHHSTHIVAINLNSNAAEMSTSCGSLNWITLVIVIVIAVMVIIAVSVYRSDKAKLLRL